ncbi:RNA polymerase III C11 subunit [Marasmius tenuissimus]|uniref:RNA polymerase III C11 subunit n=1 Tax=Marasmius tenuissimus TaxID=585030 RepID=A0ABR3A609_9AGAR
MTSRTKLKRKEVDDVLGGEEMWKHADSTAASCPRCNNSQAYFYQLQIRSADEPMTTFYRYVLLLSQLEAS